MPKRNRPYLNNPQPDQADSVDPSVSITQPDLTEPVSPDIAPEPDTAVISRRPAEPEEAANFEQAAESNETVGSGSPEKPEPPREDFSLKRRKPAHSGRIVSDFSDNFDPNELLGNNKPKKTAPSVSGTINQEWLNSNRQAGFIPTDSGSTTSSRRKRLKAPSALFNKLEPMLHEFRERFSGSDKPADNPRPKRSPGVKAGSADFSQPRRSPGVQAGSPEISQSRRSPGGQAGSPEISQPRRSPGGQAGSPEISQPRRSPGDQAGSPDISQPRRSPGDQAGSPEISQPRRSAGDQAGSPEPPRSRRSPGVQTGSEGISRPRRSPGVQAGIPAPSRDASPKKRTLFPGRANARQENRLAGYRPGEEEPEKGGITLFGLHISSNTVRLILMGIFGAIALYSLIMIARIVWRSIRTSQVNQELSQRHSQSANSDTEDIPFTIYSEEDSGDNGNTDGTDAAIATASSGGEGTDGTAPSDDSPEGAPVNTPSQEQVAALASPTPAPVVLTTKFHRIGGDALPEMASLYKDNRDLVGWLNIPDVLDLPVVYKDNVYYLTHDFYKKKNTSGTLFLDENHPYKEKAQNLLFHGHNMRDGSMFGRLTQYKSNLNFLKNNAFFTYSSLWEKEQYVIFAVLQVSLNPKDPTFFNYFTHATFRTDIEFITYISDLMAHSMYAIPIDVKPSDPLITLSTCLEEDRLVIVARRLRAGESRHHLKEIVQSAAKL